MKSMYLIPSLILGSALAIAQTQPATSTDTNQPAASDKLNPVRGEDKPDYGWIGLIGLAGLAGLARRDKRHDVVVNDRDDRNRIRTVDDVRKVG